METFARFFATITFMSKTIVLTGGAGFIGSALLRTLNEQGKNNILIVDDLDHTDKWKNLIGKKFLEIIPIQALFNRLAEKRDEVEAIFHLGACSSTVETDGNFLIENNTRFSIRLAEFALKNEIRMIYASSAATYGDGSRGFFDDHALLEDLAPLNLYGFSKHLFDLWALREKVLDQLVGLKYFNVFGPNESHKGRMASAVWHLVPQIQKEGVVRLFRSNDPKSFGDGEQCRDFIYVKDAARITSAFLDSKACGIFNVGRGEPGTWNALADAIFTALNKPVNIQYIPMPDDLAGKYQNYTMADMGKTKLALGSEAVCQPLHEGVFDYVVNHILPERRW